MKCILLVDDSAIVRHSIRQVFEAHGYLICGEAENGQEAIEKAEKLHPDLVVLDLSMPGMNGLEAARILSRTMPPWLADPNHGQFKNDRRMTQAEIDTIARWADSGAHEGRPQDLPKLPDFVEGWSIGKPDMVVSLLEEVDVPAEGVVPYKYYKVPSNFTEDKWVESAEIRAGNRSLVHHVIVFMLDEKGKRIGGLIILRAASFEEARQIVDSDPHRSSGLWDHTIHRWRVSEGSYTVRVKVVDGSGAAAATE
jgi:CheY-like chemotaxis protein